MMSKLMSILMVAAISAVFPFAVSANDGLTSIVKENVSNESVADSLGNKIASQIVRPDSILNQKVIVGKDTVNLIIPEHNFGRYDRGLFNYLFIPKGQWSFGLTASYGEFNSEDTNLLSYITDFDFEGHSFSIRPYISYFFAHNQSIGMKLGYSRNSAELGSLDVDFGEDLNFSLKDVDYRSEKYSASIFYRHYIGLDDSRRFAVFNEVDLEFSSGNGSFSRQYGGVPRVTETVTTEARMNFSPGFCCFVHDYVSFNVSFGVFGVYLTKQKQKTDNVEEGSRFSSGANFKFNLFNINMGIAVHI